MDKQHTVGTIAIMLMFGSACSAAPRKERQDYAARRDPREAQAEPKLLCGLSQYTKRGGGGRGGGRGIKHMCCKRCSVVLSACGSASVPESALHTGSSNLGRLSGMAGQGPKGGPQRGFTE